MEEILFYPPLTEPLIFDTHAHYDDEAFDADRDEVLSSLPSKGVSLVINPASNMVSAAKSIALSEKYDYIYAAVGVHPENIDSGDTATEILPLTKEKGVVAIGEIGLDYHWVKEPLKQETKRSHNEIIKQHKVLCKKSHHKIEIYKQFFML